MRSTQIKTTHTQMVAQVQISEATTVCQLLDWSQAQYCEHQFDQYTAFINHLFFGYPASMVQQVSHSSIMRGFWNNEWAQRNVSDFLPFAVDLTEDMFEVDPEGCLVVLPGMSNGDAYLIDEYQYVHNHLRLMNDDDFMRGYNHVLSLIRKAE